MADEFLKYLTARLTLDTSDLALAQERIKKVKGDLADVGKDDKGPESRFEKIRRAADDVAKVGDKLTVGVTLPLTALGAAAGQAANEFTTTFTRMETLAGVAATEVDGLKDTVKGLAGETGRAPQELAEALYFIRSAGLDGAVAVDTLRVSAKAAAVGLGETNQVADALTSVISAYGKENITAAEAANVLVKTAREGKAEAAELAPQFGRLLPVATNLGISFDQVGAGLAFLTRQSGDASLASTQLSGVMNALLKPSAEAKDLLEGVGLSSGEVRRQLREEGLLATLQSLTDRFKGNSEAIGTVFADVQGLQGVLALTGAGAADAADVFATLKGSTDELGDAFAKVADDDAFKQQQALAGVKVALIDMGEKIAPLATKVLGFGADVAAAFSKLPEGMQQSAVAAGLLLAALGPVLSLGGRLVDTFDTVKKGISSLSAAFSKTASDSAGAAAGVGGVSSALGPAGIAIAGVTAAVGVATLVYGQWRARKEELKKVTDALRGSIGDETKSVEAATLAATEKTIADKGLTDELSRAGVTYSLVNEAVLGSAEAQREYRRRLVESGEVQVVLREGTVKTAEALRTATAAFIATGQQTDLVVSKGRGFLGLLGDLGGSLRTVAKETLDQAVASGNLSRAQADAAENTLKAADGTTDYASVLDFARAAMVQHTDATKDDTKETGTSIGETYRKILGAKEQADAEQEAARAIELKAKALKAEYEEVRAGFDAQIAYERAQERERAALEKVVEAQKTVAKGGKDLEKNKRDLEGALVDARQAMLDEALAAAELDAKQQGLGRASDNASRSLEIQAEHLEGVRDTLAPDSPLRAYLDDYIRKLRDEIPRQIETQLRANVTITERTFRSDNGDTILKKIGGPIPGPRDAPVPITAHGGEFVLSADVVDAIKRGQPTLGLGARIAGGDAGGIAPAGGGVGGTTVVEQHYHANVVGSPVVVDERALGELFGRMEALYAR